MFQLGDEDVESLALHEHAGVAIHRKGLQRGKDQPVVAAAWLARGLGWVGREARGLEKRLADLLLVQGIREALDKEVRRVLFGKT